MEVARLRGRRWGRDAGCGKQPHGREIPSQQSALSPPANRAVSIRAVQARGSGSALGSISASARDRSMRNGTWSRPKPP